MDGYFYDTLFSPPGDHPVPKGWVCPKCGRVWGPNVPSCQNCNDKIIGAPNPPVVSPWWLWYPPYYQPYYNPWVVTCEASNVLQEEKNEKP